MMCERRQRPVLVCLGLSAGVLLLAVATFAVNVRNRLICLDDYEYVVKNVALADGLTPQSIYWSFKLTGYADNWHPLAWMSHALDNTLADGCGLDWRVPANVGQFVVNVGSDSYARLVHGENILIHAANALLLWLLMLVLFHDREKGQGFSSLPFLATTWLFALFWALHPLRVEVVAWVSERKELLCVFFMLLALIAYTWNEKYGGLFEHRETPGDPDWANLLQAGRFVARNARTLTFAFFCCALLSKPVAVTLPAVIFAYDWLISRRALHAVVLRIIPYAAASLLVCHMTMVSQAFALDVGARIGGTAHVLSVFEAPIIYLRQTFWPIGLAVDYPFPDAGTWPVFAVGCLLVAGLLALAAVVAWRRLRQPQASSTDLGSCPVLDALAFAAAWVYVGLLPMLGIVRVGFEPHSDRYTYWVGCGVAVFSASLAMRFLPKLLRFRRMLAFAAISLLLALAALSIRQSLVWRDSESLYGDAIEKYHGEAFVQFFGELLEEKGGEGIGQAEALFRRNLSVRKTPRARASLALHLAVFKAEEKDALREARLLARQAIREDPASMCAYAALGFADHHEGLYRSAFDNMRKAYALGYVSEVVQVNLDEWEHRARIDGPCRQMP